VPSPKKPKPKTPSPSPRTKRTTQVKANFEKYWSALNSDNRKVVRNYIKAYKSPSPVKKMTVLNAAKRNVNALKTAKARKEYKRARVVNMTKNNLKELGKYINKKNLEARNARAAKKSVVKK
jgi:hypothetical protein